MFLPISPVSKPRMTRADAWKKRACVLRYWSFKDAVRESGLSIPVKCKLTFYIEMPKSWSQKRRVEQEGKPHTQKPDIDNLIKGLLDAVFADDAHIWSVHAEKLWATTPGIRVEPL